jgi:hypothetical protein
MTTLEEAKSLIHNDHRSDYGAANGDEERGGGHDKATGHEGKKIPVAHCSPPVAGISTTN